MVRKGCWISLLTCIGQTLDTNISFKGTRYSIYPVGVPIEERNRLFDHFNYTNDFLCDSHHVPSHPLCIKMYTLSNLREWKDFDNQKFKVYVNIEKYQSYEKLEVIQ